MSWQKIISFEISNFDSLQIVLLIGVVSLLVWIIKACMSWWISRDPDIKKISIGLKGISIEKFDKSSKKKQK